MSVIFEYTLKEGYKPTKKDIAICDRGRKGFQSLMVVGTKITNPKATWFIWFLTRFFKRTVTDKYIRYEFFLLPGGRTIGQSYER